LRILAAGSVVAQENGASSSPTAEAVWVTEMAERTIDERIIDRLASFDSSDGDRSGRYSVSLDLENEDSDWNFEVTVTMEF
jgi:hypothetical protein